MSDMSKMLSQVRVQEMSQSELNDLKRNGEGNAWPWYLQCAGSIMAHNYYVHHLISNHVRSIPNLTKIVELGTGYGTMTIPLALNAISYGGLPHKKDENGIDTIMLMKDVPVVTFDIKDIREPQIKKVHDRLNVRFIELDLFQNVEIITHQHIPDGPIYLLCDNGNKKKEFEIFVPKLAKGSLISVHDYMQEFFDVDAQELIDRGVVEEVEKEEWMKYDCQFATYRRI